MRRIYFSFFIFFLSLVSINAQNKSYTLKGKTNDTYNGKKVYIQKLNPDRNGLINLDSTVVRDGRFEFIRHIDSSEANLNFIATETPMSFAPIVFVPENGQITLSMLDSPERGGTPRNKDLQNFMSKQDSLQIKIQEIVDYYKNLNQTSENYAQRVEMMKPLIETLAQERYEYAMSNIQSDLGEFIALTSFQILPPDRILELVNATRPQFKDSKLGRDVIQYYEAQKLKTPGEKFKDFELTNTKGEKVKLSDFAGKGKIVLVDFWASWCGPCIKEMPILIEVYAKYKDKGFEIVGVSLDEQKESWLKAIERLNITWPQMSDLKGWKSAAALTYGIDTIPFTLLLDGEGNIIASNLQGQALLDKLNELMK